MNSESNTTQHYQLAHRLLVSAGEHLRELVDSGYVNRNCLGAFVRAECERLDDLGLTCVWERFWQIQMSTLVTDLVCNPKGWHSINPEEWLLIDVRTIDIPRR